MKHITPISSFFKDNFQSTDKLHEAVIDWRDSNVPELEQRVRTIRGPIRVEDFAELAQEYGIDVIDYDQFIEELEPEYRDVAPPRSAKLFALFNPNLLRPQIVTSLPVLPPPALLHALHMIKHETIHSKQAERRPDHLITGGWDVSDPKKYFSNKDEVMAFAHSVVDSLISMGARTPAQAMSMLKRSPVWDMIDRAKVDARTRKRYLKMIYQYLLLELGEE